MPEVRGMELSLQLSARSVGVPLRLPRPMKPPPDLHLPRWAWLLLAGLTAFMLLPLYLRYFGAVVGACVRARLLDILMPRVG